MLPSLGSFGAPVKGLLSRLGVLALILIFVFIVIVARIAFRILTVAGVEMAVKLTLISPSIR